MSEFAKQGTNPNALAAVMNIDSTLVWYKLNKVRLMQTKVFKREKNHNKAEILDKNVANLDQTPIPIML